MTLDIYNYAPYNSTIIIGFSGGPDSVCLLNLLSKLQESHNLTLIAAHLDHQWRKDSAKDAMWCKQFCLLYKSVRFVSQVASELNFKPKTNGSKEDTGRQLRRQFFSECAEKYQATHIALAHHKDDQVETFFIRLARGSSVAGLGSIKRQDGIYIRPMLHIAKQEILEYLNYHQIKFLIDSTNTNPAFLRNRIRHSLVPMLETIDSRLPKSIISCIDQMQKTDDFLHQTALQTLQKISTYNEIKIDQFLDLHIILQQRIIMLKLIIQKISCVPSQGLFNEVIKFLRSEKHNEHQMHKSFKIIKNKSSFSFKAL